METEHRMAHKDESSGQEQIPFKEKVTEAEVNAVPVETPAMLAPNLDNKTKAGPKSTLLNSLDGTGGLAKDSPTQNVELTTKGMKRERPALTTQLQEGAEVLKRRSSTVLVGLQETVVQAVLKAGEEWNASICANKSMQEGLLDQIEAGKKRVTALLKVQKDLLKTIDAQKKEVTALQQERKALISKTDAQEEMERELLNEHEKVLDKFGAEKESLTKALQESKQEVGIRREREMVLLQERQALIDEIRAFQQEKKQSSCKSTAKEKFGKSDGTIEVLWGVSQKVLALAMEVEEKLQGAKTTCPRSTTPCLEMPPTLAASKEEAEKMILRARDALSEAAKKLKKDQVEVEMMISCCRKGVLDRILGRTKVATEAAVAPPDIPDEIQIMEQQCQMEQKNSTAPELKEGEQRTVPRKRMKPQRFRASP